MIKPHEAMVAHEHTCQRVKLVTRIGYHGAQASSELAYGGCPMLTEVVPAWRHFNINNNNNTSTWQC